MVSEEPGVGLGAGLRGTVTADPGDAVGHGPASIRVRVDAHPVPMWVLPSSDDDDLLRRAVFAGEAGGRWLWLVLRPASAVLLLRDDWMLADVTGSGPRRSRCRSAAAARVVRHRPSAGPRVGFVPIDLHTHSRPLATARRRRRSWCAAAAAARARRARAHRPRHRRRLGRGGRAAAAHGITLVRGIEISTRYDGRGVHLLAYLPDPTYQPLADELARVLDGRDSRLPAMWSGCAARHRHHRGRRPRRRRRGGRHWVDRTSPTRWSPMGVVGRPRRGLRAYLGAGRPGVRRRATRGAAGRDGAGARGRRRHRRRPPVGPARPALLTRPRSPTCSGAGWPGSRSTTRTTTPAAATSCARIAADLGLVVTGSSDHHGTGKVDHELGCNTTDPDRVRPALTWPRSRARRAVDAGGRGAVSSVVDGVLLTEVFVTLFVIMDPVGTVPIFLSLTSGPLAGVGAPGRLAGGHGLVRRDHRRSRSSGSRSWPTCTSRCRPCRAPAACCCSWSPSSC